MVNDTANLIVGTILWIGFMILMIMAMKAIARSSRGRVKPSKRSEGLNRAYDISQNNGMIARAKIGFFGSIIHFFLFMFFLILFLMALLGGGAMFIDSIINRLN